MAKKEADRKMQPSCVQQLLDAHDGGASLVGACLGGCIKGPREGSSYIHG